MALRGSRRLGMVLNESEWLLVNLSGSELLWALEGALCCSGWLWVAIGGYGRPWESLGVKVWI